MPFNKGPTAHLNTGHRIARGIVGCWRFGGRGQTVHDLSGLGYHLTVSSGTTWVPTYGGWAMYCDNSASHNAKRGADQCGNFIGFPFAVRLKGFAPAWTGNPGALVAKGTSVSSTDSWFIRDAGPTSVSFSVKSVTATSFNFGGVPIYLDMVFSTNLSGSLTLYLNGLKRSSSSVTSPVDTSSKDFRLGSDSAGSAVATFQYDTLMLWNREVTQHEVLEMFRDDRPIFRHSSDRDH